MILTIRTRQTTAANALEDLEVATKEIIRQLRAGVSPGLAYALVYDLRRRVGYTLRPLGEGVPQSQHSNVARDIIDSTMSEYQPGEVCQTCDLPPSECGHIRPEESRL